MNKNINIISINVVPHPLFLPFVLPLCADIPLPVSEQVADVEEEQKAQEPEKWMELGLQSMG